MSADRLFPGPEVRAAPVDGRVVLLDVRDGEYRVLNAAATAMWDALTGDAEGEAERLRRLGRASGEEAEELREALRDFAADCRERGYLGPIPTAASSRPVAAGAVRRPGFGRAWWSLLLTRRSLARGRFADTYRAWGALPRPNAEVLPPGPGRDAALARAERLFVRAENLFPSARAPSDCLPRSLALYRFLLGAGFPVGHRIGVRRSPFRAHAWVECDGRALLQPPGSVAAYTVLAAL